MYLVPVFVVSWERGGQRQAHESLGQKSLLFTADDSVETVN